MKKKILKLTVSLIISIGVYNVYCIKQTENNSQMSTLMIANIEALASGTPVIGTFNGGAEDIITHDNGYIVDIDDIDSLARAMKDITINKEKFVPEKLREDCFKRYSPDIIADKIISVYKDIVEEGEV